ncbi:MAG: aminotransferase class I/II-fold pyridoxal phosphate-dependent enzyme [Pseudomonadota bacterium]
MTWPYPLRSVDDAFSVPADTLGMDPEEMRRLGHKVVDMVVDRAMRRNAEPAILTGEPKELMTKLGGALPEKPMDPDQSIELLAEWALSHQQHGDHTRYFARVPGPAAFAAILGEWLGTGFNTIATSWGGGSGPSTIETVVLQWIAEMLGLPARTEGVLLSGSSIANLIGIAAARAELGPGLAYYNDQTHASVVRDLHVLGFAENQLRCLPSDPYFRTPMGALTSAIEEDRDNGLKPMLVIANAGTTNTGARDPLNEIADLCADQGLWMHVDGAYGAPAAVTSEGRDYLCGLERADSIVFDAHKWFFQPYDVAGCLVTRPGALERCFAMHPEYLRDVQEGHGEVNFGDRSLELTRRARGLKLWMSLRTYGAQGFREAVQQGIENAKLAEGYLTKKPDTWEIVSPAQIGIVCFALKDADPQEHAARAEAVSKTGYACVTSTTLQGRSVLRLCTINPLTTADEIKTTIDLLASVACATPLGHVDQGNDEV